MDITYKVAMEILSHEAIVRKAYKDSVGVWTWSVGITNATGHDVTRYIDKPQSLEKCLEIFVWALEKYATDVREAFKGYELTEEQFAAALSFHYNTGAIKRASWVKLWKSGYIAAAKKSFMQWKRPAGIIGRRKKERDLFFNGQWSSDGTAAEYPQLTRKYTPVWSSRIEVDIQDALESAMGLQSTDNTFEKPSPNDAASVVSKSSDNTQLTWGGLVLKAVKVFKEWMEKQ